VIDVFNTKDLTYEVESKKKGKYMSQLGTFFSSSNQVLFALSMSPIVRDLTQTFHKLNADKGDFKLIPNIPNELGVMSRRVDHIFSEETFVGRKKVLNDLLRTVLNVTKKKKLSMISLVGMGGVGKSALAKVIFNDVTV